MIKIRRADCPKVLKGSPTKGTHYNKKEVVRTLWDMQHEKCCYCEQNIPGEGHLKAVEHFRPKSVYKGLRNDWENLLLACAQCNGKKSDRFPTELTDDSGEAKVLYQKRDSRRRALIIDPSGCTIDPEDHIDFVVDDREETYGLCRPKNNSRLGKKTVHAIGLYRTYYTNRRRSFHCDVLLPAWLSLLKAERQKDQRMLAICKNQFAMLLSAEGEFAAYARGFARDRRVHERFGIRIPAGAELASAALGGD